MTSHKPDQAVTIRLLPSSNRAKCRHRTGTRLTPITDRTRTEQEPDQDHVERSITVQGPNKYRTVTAPYCDRAVTVHGPSPHLDRTMQGPCKDRAGTIQRPCCNRSVTVPSPCDCNRTVTILSPSFCRKMHAVVKRLSATAVTSRRHKFPHVSVIGTVVYRQPSAWWLEMAPPSRLTPRNS